MNLPVARPWFSWAPWLAGALLLAIGCGREEREGSGASLAELIETLCPEGPVPVTRYAWALPDAAALIAGRIERSTGEHFDDWMHAGRPYSPAYGVTPAEFDQLRRAWGSEERVLLTLDDHVIEFVHKPTLSRVISGVELAALNDVELHAEADMIRTYWGDLQPGESYAPDFAEGHALHGFEGRRWSMQEGDWESARRDPQGSAKELSFALLRSPDAGEAALMLRVASRRSGVTYVDDEIILRYRVDPEADDSR